MTASSDLLEELKRLRKGPGLQAPGVTEIAGPLLHKLCDIKDGDGAGAAREKIIRWVTNLTSSFPADIKLTIETALGVNPEAHNRFYTERLDRLAEQAGRERRTISRRADDALLRLCEAALMTDPADDPVAADEWHFRRFDAVIRLDGATPVSTETRTIVANTDGIDQIDWSISVPDTGAAGPEIDVLYGAVIAQRSQPSRQRFRLDLQLPDALARGQTHTYAMEVRIAPGQPMRPTYVFWPERPCEFFTLIVRFANNNRPREVWRVHDVFHRDSDDMIPTDDIVPVNKAGEAHASFTTLRTGRGYGLQWRF
jgi:hypothetical protein